MTHPEREIKTMSVQAPAKTLTLDKLTTFRLGGTPRSYVRPSTCGELCGALQRFNRTGTPWHVLGGGSNLLVEDGRLDFAVVHVCSPGFSWLSRRESNSVRVGAGLRLPVLLARCARKGLGGLEFLAGIPGTLGGALAGNAGAWGHNIAERVRAISVVEPDGTFRRMNRDELSWRYRRLDLGERIIVEADLDLEPRSPELIKSRTKSLKQKKKSRHPVSQRSAGCIFKNPPGASAGELIDRCGLKGLQKGGARVSHRHANFIVNTGDASPSDVITLMDEVKKRVKRRFGVELEAEVRHWRARPRVA